MAVGTDVGASLAAKFAALLFPEVGSQGRGRVLVRSILAV